ncbi:MAG: hypothetical protein MJ074_07490 [Oscillospiraceae bacterium]|nr:hypothetical protein [Oscillospiraceae bacterium]
MDRRTLKNAKNKRFMMLSAIRRRGGLLQESDAVDAVIAQADLIMLWINDAGTYEEVRGYDDRIDHLIELLDVLELFYGPET